MTASQGLPLLEASGLTVRYGKVTALESLDLFAPGGGVLALLGPNGAGKTTFVNCVATLVRPGEGSLRVLGIDAAAHPGQVRREIGLAGQYAAVEAAMTGRENLEMTARLFGHRAKSARMAAASVIDRLGLELVADRRVATYSGGQRRRLDLGASLVGAPRLLLLDEPTTGLDPSGRAEMWAAVRGLVAEGTDVLLTTHYLDEANELASQVVVIDHGRTVATGSVADLRASIGAEQVHVVVRDRADLDRASALLERLSTQAARQDPPRRAASVPAPGGARTLRACMDSLETAGVAFDEIGLRLPTLDEVFAALTTHAEGPEPDARSPRGALK
ncbi:MAG: ABC transporter ATP-binding protein [Streptosporangiaceae bacterium]